MRLAARWCLSAAIGRLLTQTRQKTAEAQRAYVMDVLATTGWSRNRLANAIDVRPSTLTRFLNAPPREGRTLHAANVERIAEATGIAPPQAIPTQTTPGRPLRGFRDDGEPFKAIGQSNLKRAIEALIGNRPAVDAWTLRTNALELHGYLPGDLVIVDLGRAAKPGEVICAQVYDWKGMKAETVFRIYEPPYLLAASNDPRFRKPIHIDPEHVTIKGVVLPHRLRPEEPAS